MNKKFILTLSILLVVCLGIGGKVFMDKRETDKEELRTIQTDLANYLYNNYRIYKKDKEQVDIIYQEFDKGNGILTEEEYFNKLENLKEYSDIKKIEFTKFSVTPMNTVKVYFTINNVIHTDVNLDTVSAETNKPIYKIRVHSGSGPYYLEEAKKTKTNKISKENIVYYEGGID